MHHPIRSVVFLPALLSCVALPSVTEAQDFNNPRVTNLAGLRALARP